MNKIISVFVIAILFSVVGSFIACNNGCINEILLENLSMDFEVNSGNNGVLTGEIRNSGDTIKSHTNQFYNNPEYRRLGKIKLQIPFFVTTAYAASDCIDREEYASRMDLEKTEFRLNVAYDGTADGIGIIPADSNLLAIPILKANYFQDFDDNTLLAFGATGPLTIEPGFFEPINGQEVTFSFYFVERDGTIFEDDATGFVNVQ